MSPVREAVLRCLLLFPGLLLVPGIPSSSVPMNVLRQSSITLACKLDNLPSIQVISWKYDKNGKPVLLLDSSSKPFHTYPSQFSDRLQLSNDLLTLNIGDLRMEDSGKFYTDIGFKDGTTDLCVFNVTVYEPVPSPSIKIKQRNQNNDWCNLTLHCSVPRNISSLSYSWIYRDRDSDQPYLHAGDTIHISLRNNFWNSSVLCIVDNPVDKKNVSALVICGGKVGSSVRTHVITGAIITVTASILVIGALALGVARKWTKKEDPPAEDKRREPQREPQYIQVTTSSSDGANEIRNNSLYKASQPKRTATTIYTEIKHPDGAHG